MAIKIADEYTYSNPADTAYPGGSFKNASGPEASDGTPLEKKWANDWLGFFAGLIARAGLVYSGAPDTAVVSQYLQALDQIISAGDVDLLDGYHAAQGAGANQIPVLDGLGNLALAGETFSFLEKSSWAQTYQLAGDRANTLIRAKDKVYLGVNARYDGTNWRRLATGYARLLEITTTTTTEYHAVSGAAGSTIAWDAGASMLNTGMTDRVGSVTISIPTRDTDYTVNTGVNIKAVAYSDVSAGALDYVRFSGTNIIASSQGDSRVVSVVYTY